MAYAAQPPVAQERPVAELVKLMSEQVADRVAVLAVPFGPQRREILPTWYPPSPTSRGLVMTFTWDTTGSCCTRSKTPIAGLPHETAGKRHCQIEAEPVHMHLGHQIAPSASRWVEHDCASRHGPASTRPRRWASRVLGGMPGWQIVLIAADSALLASALTLLAVRLARRNTPAQPSHP